MIKGKLIFTLAIFTSLQTYSCKKAGNGGGDEETKVPVAAAHSIIPLPQNVSFTGDEFVLDNSVKIVAGTGLEKNAGLINAELSKLAGISLSVKEASSGKAIQIKEDPGLGSFSYTIYITSDAISIAGKDKESVFNAVQSLRQYLWDSDIDKGAKRIRMRGLKIEDKPAYDWRVFHIDVARNFYTKDYLKKLIDQMALYKLNKLHLHLTDDQGWRLPVDKYPALIEEGSWRAFNKYDLENIERAKSNPLYAIDSRFVTTKNEEKIYKASYTKAELKELVAYAAQNFIEIIPEVDMPGHMYAAIKAYPWLSAKEQPGWGKEFSWPISPWKPEVKQFAYDVLDELMEIFSAKYIHIGNDEVDKSIWEESDECRKYMAANNLTSVKQIQQRFILDLQSYAEQKGRKVIVWDDASEVGVNKDALITYWRDWIMPNTAVANGNRFILTPWTWFYLSGSPTDENLRNLYTFQTSDRFGSLFNGNIDGYQACVWTENIPSEPAFEYYVYPRFQAFSEVVWSDSRRGSLSAFLNRLKAHFKNMDQNGIRYKMPGLQ